MRTRLILIALGVVMVAVGLWVATLAPSQLNEGNQCTVNGGCRNVTTNISYVGPGAIILVIGLGVAIYGYRKSEVEE